MAVARSKPLDAPSLKLSKYVFFSPNNIGYRITCRKSLHLSATSIDIDANAIVLTKKVRGEFRPGYYLLMVPGVTVAH
jgi:hypothetical protein